MGQKRRILLVDDETSILFAFSQFLKTQDVEIDTAETAEQANALIEKNEYAAAVVDLRLTGAVTMEGFLIIQTLKRRCPHCKVMVVTAYGGAEIRSDVERMGADFYFEKPVSPKVIRETLKKHGIYAA